MTTIGQEFFSIRSKNWNHQGSISQTFYAQQLCAQVYPALYGRRHLAHGVKVGRKLCLNQLMICAKVGCKLLVKQKLSPSVCAPVKVALTHGGEIDPSSVCQENPINSFYCLLTQNF